MPGRNGTREIRGYVEETLAEQFEALAAQSTKTKVLEEAINALANGGGRTGGTTAILRRLDALAEEVGTLRSLMLEQKTRLEKLTQEHHHTHWAAHQAVARHDAWQAVLQGCWWYRLLFGKPDEKARLFPQRSQGDT